MNEKSLKELLSSLSAALMKSNLEANETSVNFNIFNVLGVEAREVIICRFLGYLLDSACNHKMEESTLLTFVQDVLCVQGFTEEDAKTSRVVLEDKIDNDRRVDIVLYTPRGVFPIEVKIWAGDQDAQLADYFAYYNRNFRSERIYYLTPTGWKPSAKSRRELTETQIVCISFSKGVKNWLTNIQSHEKLPSAVKISLQQFSEVIYNMCKKSDELAAIKDVLKLNQPFEVSEMLKTAITFLSYKDAIEKEIMRQYLQEKLEYDKDTYILDACDEEDCKEVNDKHALLRVILKETAKPVAWICVDTNLYLVAKNVKSPKNDTVWDPSSVAEKEYFWQYISPSGLGHKFALKYLNEFPDDNIKIEQCLNEIACK